MRCEFFDYFEAMLRSPRPKSNYMLSYIAGYATILVSAYFGIAAGNFGGLAVAFLAAFLFITGSMSGSAYFNNTPNLVSSLPLSPKKSLFYRFLAVLTQFLLGCLIVLAFFLVIFVIVFCIVLIVAAAEGTVGDLFIFSGGEEEEVVIINRMGVHGGIFSAAYFVFMYGAGMIAGFIKNFKTKNIFSICLVAVVLAGMLLTRNPFVAESYQKMAVPWLCTSLCIVAAIASLGASVYIGIKQYNKNY